MADELMTTRELREFLRLDRTTIYAMLKEGRIPGFKVGGQWRFSRREIEAWLSEQRAEMDEMAVHPSPDALPRDYMQSIQAIFAEAMGVGSVVTRLDGQPLTQVSNPCAFCEHPRRVPALCGFLAGSGPPEGTKSAVAPVPHWAAVRPRPDRSGG
jgi:excisionase family DNA binding protein